MLTSTAEWTKFSPVIANSISSKDSLDDLEALNSLSDEFGFKIPQNIKELFNKNISQSTIVDKDCIEDEILKFL